MQLSLPSPKSTGPFLPTHHHHLLLLRRRLPSKKRNPPPISATKLPFSPPPPSPPGEVYQPFRPPPSSSPLPSQYRNLNPSERLAVLRDRLGLWHEYAPLVSSLARDGFNPPSIEEATGLSGVEQNRIVVAAQVRDSLLQYHLDPPLLAYFDSSGSAELLYELRLLNAAQRAAAARRVAEHRLDPKAAQELARAVKDFPRRRGDDAWSRFSAADPGDCLAYARFRLSREAIAPADKIAALEKALEAADTEGAKNRILEEMEKASKGPSPGDGEAERISVPVVRLRYGEVAETSSVAVMPAVKAAEGGEEGVVAAPEKCKGEGEFGVVAAERGWERWAVLPGWAPAMEVAGNGGGVVVEFADGRVLPWRRVEGSEEAVLVVVDRRRKAVAEERGYYLAAGMKGEGGLVVEQGGKLLEKGIKEALGAVVLIVRPPRDEVDDQLGDEDWE